MKLLNRPRKWMSALAAAALLAGCGPHPGDQPTLSSSPPVATRRASLALAAGPSPITIVARASMANYIFRIILPTTLDLTPGMPAGSPKTVLSAVDLRYCTAIDKSHGKLIGILMPDAPPAAPPT